MTAVTIGDNDYPAKTILELIDNGVFDAIKQRLQLGNVANFTPAEMPLSDAMIAALSALTPADVGLDKVINLAPADMPVSTATAAAIAVGVRQAGGRTATLYGGAKLATTNVVGQSEYIEPHINKISVLNNDPTNYALLALGKSQLDAECNTVIGVVGLNLFMIKQGQTVTLIKSDYTAVAWVANTASVTLNFEYLV